MNDDMREDEERQVPERVFAALPAARGKAFARTWWGVRWQQALEHTALDSEQLRVGRRYAKAGAVGAMSVRPGRITAMVRDKDGTVRRADVLMPQLDDACWDRLLEVTARTAGHLAALLDGEMTPELVEDAEAVQVSLFPERGDLQADCECGEWDHCSHTAAVCYQIARILDEDPLILLLLLGRDRHRLIEDLHHHSFAQAMGELPDEGGSLGSSPEEDEADGVPAAQAYAAAWPAPDQLPDPPPPSEQEPEIPRLGTVGAAPTDLDPSVLELILRDTAVRAKELLADALAPGHATTAPAPPLADWADAVRFAATWPLDQRLMAALATGSDQPLPALERAAMAWRFGAAFGLQVLETSAHAADPVALARARDVLTSAWETDETRPRFHSEGNRWTVADRDLQLRYAADGRWWPFAWDDDAWRPAGPAGFDPSVVLAELGCP